MVSTRLEERAPRDLWGGRLFICPGLHGRAFRPLSLTLKTPRSVGRRRVTARTAVVSVTHGQDISHLPRKSSTQTRVDVRAKSASELTENGKNPFTGTSLTYAPELIVVSRIVAIEAIPSRRRPVYLIKQDGGRAGGRVP